jgi:hypothetical protein
LLLLHLVAHEAPVVEAPRVVPGAGPHAHASAYQRHNHGSVCDAAHRLAVVALNERRKPLGVNVLGKEVAVQRVVPEVPFVRGNALESVFGALLHPLDAALTGTGQVVAKRKVKAII